MVRPREFDEETVLEAAMRRFWQNGYEQTSIRDLVDEMGLTSASIYNAFGDKRSLYRQALNYYVEQGVHDRIARLASVPPYDAIRGFFYEVVSHSVSDRDRRGCMLVNAALDVPASDKELRAIVAKEMARIENFFFQRIRDGQKSGVIACRQSANTLAKVLLSVLLGLRVLARARPERRVLKKATDGALALLKN
jgi:TetR/AcrR family transcriptional regulator, transcriptional repressor for nem operon